MPANKPVSARVSAEAGIGETDLAKLDAHVIQLAEYKESPELTDDWFAEADHHVGGVLIRRGRPKLAFPKKQVTLRLDQDVIDRMRATGPGWQRRINEVLKEWLHREPA